MEAGRSVLRQVLGTVPLLALAACPGYELGHLDVEADVVDGPDESAPTDSEPTHTGWDVTAQFPCGVQQDGSYLGPCMLELEPRRYSTLCDESIGYCVAPEAACHNGWCRIPARSYLSGAGQDGQNLGALDAAIMVVRRDFEIHQTETTLAQFMDVMGYEPDGTSNCGSDCPAAGVSVFEAMEFANRLSDLAGLERCYELVDCGNVTLTTPQTLIDFRGWRCESSRFAGVFCNGYRLPTSGEWELAARAGSPFCFEIGPLDSWVECDAPEPWIPEVSTYCESAHVEYRPCLIDQALSDNVVDPCYGILPVLAKRPNAFGLYGVHGNVMEWVQFVGPDIFPLTPHRWEPPYAIVADDATITHVISKEDPVYQRGGAYFWHGAQTCPWTIHQYEYNASLIEEQLTGFRLARTLGDDARDGD